MLLTFGPKILPNMNNAHCDNICVSCQKVSLQIRSLQNESLQMWIQGFKGSAKRDSCLQGFLKSEEIRVKSNSLLKEFEEIHFLQQGSFRRDSHWKFVILTWQIFPLTKLLLFPTVKMLKSFHFHIFFLDFFYPLYFLSACFIFWCLYYYL